MSWYRFAQQYQDSSQSIISTGTPGTSSNPAGILVDETDLRNLQNFNENSGPLRIIDRDNNQQIPVTLIHGGVDSNGKFAFSDGKGNYVYPKNEDDPTYQLNPDDEKFKTSWENRLGIGSGTKIIACHEGMANAGDFDRVTTYQGKLQIKVPTEIPSDPSNPNSAPKLFRVNIEGM